MTIISNSVLIVCVLTAFIFLIKTLAVSTRIVASRTKKIGSSNSIFNIISLSANFANALQAPLLAKTVEDNIANGEGVDTFIFRIVILSASIGSIIGIILIPSMQRILKVGVDSLYIHRNIFKVVSEFLRKNSFKGFSKNLVLPKYQNLSRLKEYQDIPLRLIFLNSVVFGFITVSILACLYAGCLNPSLRVTALSLNGVSMGLGTLCLVLFLEPHNATMIDKVVDGSISEGYIRKYLSFVVVARFLGTILGQLIFLPLANIIVFIAEMIKI